MYSLWKKKVHDSANIDATHANDLSRLVQVGNELAKAMLRGHGGGGGKRVIFCGPFM